ncbi:MAG TPA: GNVR domain-containing protein, partial [Candidatus Deferrimicrobiaceae bacterium]|nr:GNVR domain-containing protein [Candidatus Deferrimicrobiaceae bacterium]
AEEVVEMMRKRITIEVVQGKRRDSSDAFTLSFLHENRTAAMNTAARLASFFIDENLKTREQQAVGTSEFLESQLKDTKERLELQEAKVKDYKMRFMGELPQQMEANLRMLTGLQDRLRSNGDAIRTLEDRKVFLEAQVNLMEKSIQAAGDNGTPGAVYSSDPAHALLAELAQKRARLADLAARYTEKYPAVVNLKHEVATLEKRVAEMEGSASGTAAGGDKSTAPSNLTASPLAAGESRRMRAQLGSSTVEIDSLKKERKEIERSIAIVEQKIERSPRREQEMISLLRDYENQKKSYDDLLKKKLEADVAQNLEKRQKGTQFQILDPANLPEEPFQPDRKKVMGISLLLAIALGFGGTVGLESMNLTLRDVSDFKHFYKVPVLACIPVVHDRKYKREQSLRRAAVLGGIVTFFVAVSAFLLAYSDRIRNILSF